MIFDKLFKIKSIYSFSFKSYKKNQKLSRHHIVQASWQYNMAFKNYFWLLLIACAITSAFEVEFDDEYDAEVLEAFLGNGIPNLSHFIDPMAFSSHNDDNDGHTPPVLSEVPGAVSFSLHISAMFLIFETS